MVQRSRRIAQRQAQFFGTTTQTFTFTQPTAEQLEQQRQEQIGVAKQARAQKSLRLINEKIEQNQKGLKTDRENFNKLRKQLEKDGLTKSEAETLKSRRIKLERREFERTQFISELRGVKDEAATGNFRPGDLIGFASDRTQGRVLRSEARVEARRRAREDLEQDFTAPVFGNFTMSGDINQGLTTARGFQVGGRAGPTPSSFEDFQSALNRAPELNRIGRAELRPATFGEAKVEGQQQFVDSVVSGISFEEAQQRALAGEPGFIGQSTPQGESIQITGDIAELQGFGAFRQRTAAGLRSQGQLFSELGPLEGTRRGLQDIGTGGLKGGVLLAELPVNIALAGKQQDISEGVSFAGDFGKFDLGDFSPSIRELKDTPTGVLGTTAEFAPIGLGVTSLVKTGRKFGARAAAEEVLGLGAVVRVRPGGRFVELETPKSFKTTERLDGNVIRVRDIAPDVDGIGFRVSESFLKPTGQGQQLAGVGKQFTQTRFVDISRTGRVDVRSALIETPFISTSQPSVATLRTTPFDIEFPQEIGFRGETLSPFGLERGTGVTFRQGRFFRGAEGPRSVIPATRFTETRPSGFELDRSFVGLEITKGASDDIGRILSRGGRPKGPRVVDTQLDQAFNIPTPKTPTFKPPAQTIKTDLPGPDAFGVLRQDVSFFAGTGQFERTDSLLTGPSPVFKTPNLFREFTPLNVGTRTGARLGAPSRTSQFNIAVPQLKPAQFSTSIVVPRQTEIIRTGLREQNLPILTDPPTTRGGFGFGFSARGGRTGIGAFPLPPIGIPDLPRPKARGKRRLRRTPSLLAIETGITSNLPDFSRELTGIAVRPVLRRKRRKGGKR